MTAKLGGKLGKVGKSSKLKILLLPKGMLPSLNPKLVKSVLSLQNANSAIERSLSDSGNTCTKDCVNLMPETLIGLRRTKEYARSKSGSHCIVLNDKMIEGMA